MPWIGKRKPIFQFKPCVKQQRWGFQLFIAKMELAYPDSKLQSYLRHLLRVVSLLLHTSLSITCAPGLSMNLVLRSRGTSICLVWSVWKISHHTVWHSLILVPILRQWKPLQRNRETNMWYQDQKCSFQEEVSVVFTSLWPRLPKPKYPLLLSLVMPKESSTVKNRIRWAGLSNPQL